MTNEYSLTAAKDMIENGWKLILEGLKVGYGLEYEHDENFRETPGRNANSLLERCRGINSDDICKEMLKKTFPATYKGMIIVNPIEVHSLCPHHFEDVKYIVRMGYIPQERCVGLSKIGRVIKLLGSQPILQEDYTQKLADMFYTGLECEGLCVVTEGRHNCMIARGLQERNSKIVMSEVRGTFLSDPSVKAEFYTLCSLQEKN